MKRSVFKFLAVAAFGLVLVGCGKDSDPMYVLASDSLNSNFNEQYWQNVAKQNPDLYKKAIAYCSSNSNKPNCVAVGDAITDNFNSGDVEH